MHRKNVTTNQGKIRFFVILSKVALNFRGVETGDPREGGYRVLPGFGRSVNPIQTGRGGRFCLTHYVLPDPPDSKSYLQLCCSGKFASCIHRKTILTYDLSCCRRSAISWSSAGRPNLNLATAPSL